MSGGWIASGPPATGTWHTIVMYGVGWTIDPVGHGGYPVMARVLELLTAAVPGPHTSVR